MGQYTLVKGRHITPEDTHVAIISDVLAEKNGLDVGDSYYVYDYDVTGAFSNYNGVSVRRKQPLQIHRKQPISVQ